MDTYAEMSRFVEAIIYCFVAKVLTELWSASAGFDLFDDELINEKRPNGNMNASDYIIDIREYDVPYHVRVAIDKGMYKRHEYILSAFAYTL